MEVALLLQSEMGDCQIFNISNLSRNVKIQFFLHQKTFQVFDIKSVYVCPDPPWRDTTGHKSNIPKNLEPEFWFKVSKLNVWPDFQRRRGFSRETLSLATSVCNPPVVRLYATLDLYMNWVYWYFIVKYIVPGVLVGWTRFIRAN